VARVESSRDNALLFNDVVPSEAERDLVEIMTSRSLRK